MAVPTVERAGFLRAAPEGPAATGALVIVDPAVANRYAGDKLAKTAQVTASGETVVHTPAAGKAVRLFWVSAINDPDASASPRIRIGFQGAGDYLYSAYAIAHWEIFEGAANQAVVVDLDQAGAVALTMHYEEF